LQVESRIPAAVQQALAAKGHRLPANPAGAWSLAEMAVIQIDPKTGMLNAGADPRADAYAWAR
jgi:gamma-glutamyltranspeptidase